MSDREFKWSTKLDNHPTLRCNRLSVTLTLSADNNEYENELRLRRASDELMTIAKEIVGMAREKSNDQ